MGEVVEKAIGKAQAAKKTVVTGATGHAPDTIEAHLPIAKVKEVLRMAVERMVPTLLPTLADRRSLEIGDGVGRYAPRLKEHGSRLVIAAEIGAGDAEIIPDAVGRVFLVRTALHRLPFEDQLFDFAVANLLTPYQGDVARALKEIGRVLAPGASLIITDFHPFGSYARRGTARVRPTESAFRGLGDYYKVARLAGLRITDVRESFLDETVRAAFVTPEEKQAYRALRDTPLVLCVLAKKSAEVGA